MASKPDSKQTDPAPDEPASADESRRVPTPDGIEDPEDIAEEIRETGEPSSGNFA